MPRRIMILIAIAFISTVIKATEIHFAERPTISPDGSQVCFVYQNDLWKVPFRGGVAKRLTSTEAPENSPVWSPDGKFIAFNSTREGQNYVYIMPSEGGSAQPVIRENYWVSDWFADGKSLLCARHNMRYAVSLYQVPIDGSRPRLITEIGEYGAVLSPDNTKILFHRRGMAYREAYTGSQNGELWEYDIRNKTYTRLTNTEFTERYPLYSHVSNSIFYAASDLKAFQIMRVNNYNFDRPSQITQFDQFSARNLSIARRNDRIVFELFDEIWKYDPTKLFGSKISKLDIVITEDDWISTINEETIQNDTYGFAVSNDDLIVAFSHKYDLFAVPRKGGRVKQITFDHAGIENIGFMNCGRTIVFNRIIDGRNKLFKVSIDSMDKVEPVQWFGMDMYNVSTFYRTHDGRWIINYINERNAGNIAIADSMMNNAYIIDTPRVVSSNFAISPDGSMAAYACIRDDLWIRELYLYDFNTNSSRKVMNDDNWIGSLHWSNDQKSLFMTRSGDIWRLDLVPRDEFELDKDNWLEILEITDSTQDKKDAPEPEDQEDSEIHEIDDNLKENDLSLEEEIVHHEKQPAIKIIWEDLDKRLYHVISDPFNLFVHKVIDDSTFYYIRDGYAYNQNSTLHKANYYGKNTREEFNFGKNIGQFYPVNNALYYLDNGVIKWYNTQTGKKGETQTRFDYQFDYTTLNKRVFDQVWNVFGLNFYDPQMHGRNWNRLYEIYSSYLPKVKSIRNLAKIVDEMIGDLNASHTGFNPREDRRIPRKPLAYLGVEFDYKTILTEGIGINMVYPLSRLAVLYNIKSGDILTHIDGVAITSKTPLDSLLLDKVDKKIHLKFISNGNRIEGVIDGLNWSAQRSLHYRYMTERRRRKVDELSNDRLGYVHIPSMGHRDYDNFITDVFTQNIDKEALVIDVRGNSGGRISSMIIDFLRREKYAYSTSRRYGAEPRPQPSRLWGKPTIVIIDENSFSDGEIFPIVYKELKLGKVIGMPTSGSVIGTWQYQLLDGSEMRMPGSGWYKLDGTNMEGTGAMPDILVDLTPGDIISDNDVQLIRAVEELMNELQPK